MLLDLHPSLFVYPSCKHTHKPLACSVPLFSPSRLPTHPSFSPPAGGAWRAATGRWSVGVKHSANLGLLKGTSSRSVELKHLRAVARDSWPLLNAAPSAYRPSLVPPAFSLSSLSLAYAKTGVVQGCKRSRAQACIFIWLAEAGGEEFECWLWEWCSIFTLTQRHSHVNTPQRRGGGSPEVTRVWWRRREM